MEQSKKTKLKKVLAKVAPPEASKEYVSELYAELSDSIPVKLEQALAPHKRNILILKEVLSDVPSEIDKKTSKLEQKINSVFNKVNEKTQKDFFKMSRELDSAFNKLERKLDSKDSEVSSIKEEIDTIKKEIKDLWWSRKAPAIDGGKTAFLSTLNDVNISGLVNNQFLKYVNGKWTNVTGSTSTGGISFETPSGAVNGINTAFSVLNTPKYIVSDGVTYFQNSGYTLSGLSVTMDIAPVGFIQSAY